MSPQTRIAEELSDQGFATRFLNLQTLGGQDAVAFRYSVKTGRHKGRTFEVAVAFQESSYPEYPPHFVWIADLSDPQIPEHSICEHEGVRWAAFSVPPSDFWDRLPSPEKNMRTYVNRHMARFWNEV